VELKYFKDLGDGIERSYPFIEMDRDGFTLLAMGFTGAKALKFKLAYIAAFNAMEVELRARDDEDDVFVGNTAEADARILDGDVVDNVPVLVAGRHRLEAVRRLGETRIQCLVFDNETTAALWEISENLHRSDLNRQERAYHEMKWIKIVEDEAKKKEQEEVLISEQNVQKSKSDTNPKGAGRKESGLSLAARKLPVPGKTYDGKRLHLGRSREIVSKTTPEAAQAAAEAGLADSTGALLEIAKTPAEQQVAKVAEIAARKLLSKPKRREASLIENFATLVRLDGLSGWRSAGRVQLYESLRPQGRVQRDSCLRFRELRFQL